tara:strand:+ start:7 stop:816 length:810 start_codon:yes stop_codon:yes gene_type:complete
VKLLKRNWQELSKETIPNPFSIKDKIIIISGAGRGIGRYLAHSMAKHSAFVYCIDKKFPKEVPKDVKKNMFNVRCDITNNRSFMKVCQNIFKTSKKIDVLVNNAGVTFPSNKKEVFYPTKNWNDSLKVNLTASFHCSQAVIKYMVKNKSGSIINITSINAELAFPKNPAYIASKGGLKMLGKSLAKDWGRFGIRVNNLGPGYIKTDMTKISYANKKTRLEREKMTFLQRWGTMDDLVGPCIFLASDASKYITGQDLYVDGGWTTNSGIS